MECNKDEATRAKGIAEEKMENNDFEGARKIALKARNLYSELENITQMLAICDVHCAAKNRILGSEKDWYGILGVERLADELTIKKQYRRLALVLHPDKNRFPGAEAAFKLIGEANLVLTDPVKRSSFDSKTRVSVRSAPSNQPPHHVNTNPVFRKQYGFQNKFPNSFTDKFSGPNQHQETGFDSTVGQGMFNTSCPFCTNKFLCQRENVNRSFHCTYCFKTFIAYDIGAQGVSLGSKCSQPGAHHVFSKLGTPNQVAPKMGVQNNTRFPAPGAGSQGSASSKTLRSESGMRTECTTKVGGDVKVKEKKTRNVYSMSGGNEGDGMPNGDAMTRESGDLKNKNRKRGRKRLVESSESCDTSSSVDTDDVAVEENFGDPANMGDSGLNSYHFVRRSTRQRQHISYNEIDDDNDYDESAIPPKRSRSDSKEEQKDALDTEDLKCGNENSFPADADNVRIEETDDFHSDTDDTIYDCPDSEFNDFDKEREEGCFAVDQIWACFDTLDGMPRFYALVRKVDSHGFKLQIAWLEADPEDEAEKNWASKELPVGCGRFKREKTQYTSDRLTFSHQVLYEKGKKRGSVVIYPRKGETWALYKDWDMGWSCNEKTPKHFKYEIVEVLSDFVAGDGVKVAYLDKVTGFLSLFQQMGKSEIDSFFIRPNELFRFSHRIPCFRMTGSERRGVPEGSFELDPNSLPLNPDDLWYPSKGKPINGNMDAEVNCSPPKSTKSNLAPGSMSMPKTVVDLED
ncbi:DNAJ heat shock N-terminal domain-containing protein [Forsythia ovata]|uniref:DNAJ heat shock N-terminal domain-containing protein n=1 Tax=Forsythia ovata TaxID=205694 RepID=A0ABD1WWJ7_9LAMI